MDEVASGQHPALRWGIRRMLAGLIVAASALAATPACAAGPTLMMMPPPMGNGQSLRALFEDPAAWQQTRARVEGIGYADHWLVSQFNDEERRRWLPMLRQWHLKLQLEVGALKEWGTTADAAFPKDRALWNRLIADGAQIDSIAMDEPLAFVTHREQGSVGYAAEQTARFVALVRQAYPAMEVGDIEAYPGGGAADLLDFIDAVQRQLRQWHVRGLDFIRLDVDWMHFPPGSSMERQGWQGVAQVAAQCRARGLPFSLVYWAADFPSLNRVGEATEQTWEDGVMHEGAEFADTGGVPDEVMVESWVQAPDRAVPETEPGTFTHSVLAASERFGLGREARR